MNNNEVYEKVRPLPRSTSVFQEDQAHGDDTHVKRSDDQTKSSEPLSHEIEYKQTDIPPMSSSSNEFSLAIAMPITDTSNEALKTDDENGMNKSYYHQQENDLVLSDLSLQQQRLPTDECEYEIDLGNGWITKSLSSHPPNDKQQQRTPSIVSADSSQPITTFKIPFTNTFSEHNIYSRSENLLNQYNEANVLFNSHDHLQPHWSDLSWKTVKIISIGTTLLALLLLVVFFVF